MTRGLRAYGVAVLSICALAAVISLSPERASAAAVDLTVGERGPVGPLGCDETSSPIEFDAVRGNSVSRGSGPDAQYLLEMKIRARPLGGQGLGSMSIHGEVGGEPGATLSLERLSEGGRAVLRWSSIDLVDGTRTGTVAAGGSELETSNYIPFGTVRPGRNRLRFRVECFGAEPLAELEVLDSTALREAEQWPARLRLTAPDAVRDPETGTALPVAFKIANTGDLPARDVEVSLVTDKARARPVGQTSYSYSELTGERSGEFLIIPRRPGPLHAELIATSANSNHPAVLLRGAVGKPSPEKQEVASPWLALAGVTAIGALALALVGRRRKRSRA